MLPADVPLADYLLRWPGAIAFVEAVQKRQDRLQVLLQRFDCPAIRASEAFKDGVKLLQAERMKLEGGTVTIRYASKLKRPIAITYPDGAVEVAAAD